MNDNLQTCIRRSSLLADSQAKHEEEKRVERAAVEEAFCQIVVRSDMEEARQTFSEVLRQEGTVELSEPAPGGLKLSVEHGSHRGTIHFQSFHGCGESPGMRYEVECGSRRCQGSFDLVRSADARATVVRLLKRFARWVYGLEDENA